MIDAVCLVALWKARLMGGHKSLKMSPDALIDQFRGIIKNLYLSL